MPDDPKAGNTITDGTTGGHVALPNAPGWFGSMISNPVPTLALIGVLSLAGVEVGQVVSRSDDKADLEAEIARVEAENETHALLERAAKCADETAALKDELRRVEREIATRDDDKFAFMSEITLYVERVAAALLGKRSPEPGARLDEYVRKGTLRGVRGGN